MAEIQYNRVIRKLVEGFGDLFNNITLAGFNRLSEQERFIIPIAYANKEKYVERLLFDGNLDKKVQITLPRLSYEMTGFTYDASRKQNTNTKNFAQTPAGIVSQYNPVPYNFDFSLYLYVRNIEDAHQVLEYILPFFTPDYTIKLNLIPEMGIIKEVPIVLNNTLSDIQYEGDRDSDTRVIIWTLNFTVKAFLYGPITVPKLITHSITNIYNFISATDSFEFVMNPHSGSGDYQIGEFVYQGININSASATAKVKDWNNFTLKLQDIQGNFISSSTINGLSSNTQYMFTSYNYVPYKYVRIDTLAPNPPKVTLDETDLTVDSGNTSITFDKTNIITTTITETP